MSRPPMTLEFFSATDPGRLRRNNEDSVAVDFEACLVVLADGMGGYNAGEVASNIATSFIRMCDCCDGSDEVFSFNHV